MATITGPSLALEDGAVFEITVTIAHATVNNASRDAYNLQLRLEYPEQYLLLPATFTYMFSNGSTGVLSKGIIIILNSY